MRPYLHFAWLGFRRQITYRAATLAGFATNIFFMLLRAAVMQALYAGRTEFAGVSLQQALTFTVTTQALIVFTSLWGWWEVMDQVNTGDIAIEMLKPVHYYGTWLARDYGRALAGLLLRGAPILLVGSLFFPLTLPQSAERWLATIAALLLSGWVSFSWRFLTNLAAFWMPDARGFGRMIFALSQALSGFLMPMALLPDWLQTICYLTPFPMLITTPLEIFLGVAQGAAVLRGLALQLAWGVALTIAGLLVLRTATRRLIIYGG
jgi:ABC-2 type transport system permease protein